MARPFRPSKELQTKHDIIPYDPSDECKSTLCQWIGVDGEPDEAGGR